MRSYAGKTEVQKMREIIHNQNRILDYETLPYKEKMKKVRVLEKKNLNLRIISKNI